MWPSLCCNYQTEYKHDNLYVVTDRVKLLLKVTLDRYRDSQTRKLFPEKKEKKIHLTEYGMVYGNLKN